MRKEYILTEEEKARKRQKIEENRYDNRKLEGSIFSRGRNESNLLVIYHQLC